jgi:hypothetical protein
MERPSLRMGRSSPPAITVLRVDWFWPREAVIYTSELRRKDAADVLATWI